MLDKPALQAVSESPGRLRRVRPPARRAKTQDRPFASRLAWFRENLLSLAALVPRRSRVEHLDQHLTAATKTSAMPMPRLPGSVHAAAGKPGTMEARLG